MATEPMTKARLKRSMGRLRFVIMSNTMIDARALDFDGVTAKPRNAYTNDHGWGSY